MGRDRHIQMVGGNCGNQFRQYAGQNVRNLVVQNAVGIRVFRMLEIRMYLLLLWGLLIRIQMGMQASTSGTQSDKAPIYDSNRSAENSRISLKNTLIVSASEWFVEDSLVENKIESWNEEIG
nr:hypothetical protein [Tanacetum cinerariifolium]